MFGFARVSWEQAVAYRDHVRAREPFRLKELAERMAATGGPIEEMDASFASLVPLWGWFVGYVLDGCPGMGPRARMPFLTSSDWSDEQLPSLGGRAQAAAIGVEHYLRLVWQRFDPPASWEIYLTPKRSRVLHADHHTTGVPASSGGFWDFDFVYVTAGKVPENWGHSQRPEALLAVVLLRSEWSAPPEQERRASVLAPLLGVDLGPEPEVAAVSPVWSWPEDWWKQKAGDVRERPVGDEMTLWRGRAEHLDEPAKLAPLPADEVARALAANGFVGEGGPVDAESLVGTGEEVVELGHVREAAQVQVMVADGAVRAVHLEPVALTKAEWRALTGDLRALARRAGARFVADDRIDG